jgi:type II secretion system protein I
VNSELRTQNAERRKAEGFTLLEVLIALAILSITLVALSRAQSQSLSVAGDSRSITTLCLLANAKMAEMEAKAFLGATTESGDFGTDFPDYAWQVKVGDSGMPNLKKIEVEARDKRKAKGGAYRLLLYKYVSS